MRPQALRRLAADLSNLHNEPLPPNYLFAPDHDADDLTQFDILLAGPQHTPYAEGVWRLHLSMPEDYPSQPPTANFRTTIFHPNVHPDTGGVCVETLKRDWDSKLTLRDVLVTISCLLIQPNPDSALNAEAGSMIQEDYDVFARRAQLMTSIHAAVPAKIAAAVNEARARGQDAEPQDAPESKAPVRHRRQMTRMRPPTRTVRTDLSPVDLVADRRQIARVQHQEQDDIFAMPRRQLKRPDEIMDDADQENLGMPQLDTPVLGTPRRPPGPPVPLGELRFDPSDEDVEMEYPPSPRKSPSKSPVKRQLFAINNNAESSRDALRSVGHTPTIIGDTTFDLTAFGTPMLRPPQQPQFQAPMDTAPLHVEPETATNEQLWELCGRDVARWNRCDFDQQPFDMVAARW